MGPARRVGLAAAGPLAPDLGRGALLAPLAERTGLEGVGARFRRLGSEGVGTLGPARGEDRPQPGELVDADLGGQGAQPGGSGGGTLGSAWRSTSGLMMSSGNGKTIVVFWFTPISSSVCR